MAVAVADLGARLGFAMTVCAPTPEQTRLHRCGAPHRRLCIAGDRPGQRYIVVSTQGKGDDAALQAALSVDSDYVAFVGSRKKVDTLKEKLRERGIPEERIAKLHAPAGFDLGAITPEEIALSILAEIVAQRRKPQQREQTDET